MTSITISDVSSFSYSYVTLLSSAFFYTFVKASVSLSHRGSESGPGSRDPVPTEGDGEGDGEADL